MAGYYLNFTCFKCNEKSLSTKGCENEINSYIVKNYGMDGVSQVICPKCKETIIMVWMVYRRLFVQNAKKQ